MLNCTFIGVKTKAYKKLVDSVTEISRKHQLKSIIKHINEIEDILEANVIAIPSILVMPGNILLSDPGYKEIEEAILKNFNKKNNTI